MPSRILTPLLAAAGGLLAAPLVWLLAYHADVGRTVDGELYRRLGASDTRAVDAVGTVITLPFSEAAYVLVVAVVVLHAWTRRGSRGALASGTILIGANLVTQVLKHVTAVDRPWVRLADGHGIDAVSWPSGHATASAALLAAAVLAAPPARRRLVALLGAAYAAAVALAVVWMGWHAPSDVLGAWAVVAAVTGVTVAALRLSEARWPARAPGGGLVALRGAG